MFQKQQGRMDKFTKEISEDQAKKTKEEHLAKKKAIENGQYKPIGED